MEEGETLTHALEREVFEETGITVKVKSLVGIYSNTRKPSIVVIWTLFVSIFLENPKRAKKARK